MSKINFKQTGLFGGLYHFKAMRLAKILLYAYFEGFTFTETFLAF